ncbi:hypothetical protein C8A00DRAFT_43091 [Chaetomidium leptoderma]|uniref:Uncharacterized protein n=1 Tax=Chaetomidium leptoderma TaxID=669021 RepID=A0AAN6VPP5_9PEZI|nr:hypothetical protein C8A00DRAFT_43091 [Chaetomidium leptoderma]
MAHHSQPTCLSGKPHDSRVSDPVVHFNGYLLAAKQTRFYESLVPESQQRITCINGKTRGLRHRLETTDHDSTAGARLGDFKQAMAQWCAVTGRSPSPYTGPAKVGSGSSRSQPPGTPSFGGANEPVDSHIKASVIYFRDGTPMDVFGLPKTFPRQKVPVETLLTEDQTRNPIMQPAEDNVVRYFHLPANNMVWVEESIARYYHEKGPEADGVSYKCRSRWPQSKTEMILQPGYWQGQRNFDVNSEIHARHMRLFCSGISAESVASEPNPGSTVLFMPYLHWETDRGRAKSAEIVKEAGKQNFSISDVIEQAKHQLDHSEAQDTAAPEWVSQPTPLVLGNVNKRKALAQVLQQLMMKYLHVEPPLHPRRTPDQAYYGALRSTRARDRDQVVYRGTTPQPHECIGMDVCPQCNEAIRKTPRLVIGRNRPDPSAIHKSLRIRIQYTRPGEILSAYNLTLIIVNETSRPKLVELFTAAIRDLTYKQTAAFDQFLIYTHLASRDYKRQRYVSSDNSTQNHLLNINPEGELLKEVKDIIDELHIMMRIKEQQQTVMESFVKHIRRALTPVVRQPPTSHTSTSAAWDLALGAAQQSPNPYVDDSKRQNAQPTLTRADNLLLDLHERISELQALLQNAQHTAAALKNLLTLKQQQAGVIEAPRSRQTSPTNPETRPIHHDLHHRHTIIFLPLIILLRLRLRHKLSRVQRRGHLPLATEMRLMFPISAGIIVASFLFAFSPGVFANSVFTLARSAVSFGWNTAVTWVLVRTGLYVVGREMVVKENRLREREGKVTGAMKAEVLRREKNMERMRAAGHVRALVERGGGGSGDGGGGGARRSVVSPYSESFPGSPSPFLSPRGGEVDIELGETRERVARKASSQIHLVPGRQG